MNFNNVISHLMVWCENKAKTYETTYKNCGGVMYVGYLFAYELSFKLSALTDRLFENVDKMQREISNLLDVHYEPCILNPPNNTAVYIISKLNKEFCEYSAQIISNKDSLETVKIPYFRAVLGDEAKILKDKFYSIWKYENTSYWFPLMGDEPKEISDKFFIMYDYLEVYMEQLKGIIGLPETHIYSYGETAFRPEHCMEVAEMNAYGGCETIYTDKDFTWAVYFSHENTVAFVGSIVNAVKKMLENEKEHWNKFEWDLG